MLNLIELLGSFLELYHWESYEPPICLWYGLNSTVAVTDLFSLANQYPLPSDSATHWTISGQSALIPSVSQELFLLALFRSHYSRRTSGLQRRKTSLASSSTDIPALKITLLPATCTKEPALRPDTRATCYSEHLLQTQETTYYLQHQKEPFLTLIQVYFCYKNKPFVVVF